MTAFIFPEMNAVKFPRNIKMDIVSGSWALPTESTKAGVLPWGPTAEPPSQGTYCRAQAFSPSLTAILLPTSQSVLYSMFFSLPTPGQNLCQPSGGNKPHLPHASRLVTPDLNGLGTRSPRDPTLPKEVTWHPVLSR